MFAKLFLHMLAFFTQKVGAMIRSFRKKKPAAPRFHAANSSASVGFGPNQIRPFNPEVDTHLLHGLHDTSTLYGCIAPNNMVSIILNGPVLFLGVEEAESATLEWDLLVVDAQGLEVFFLPKLPWHKKYFVQAVLFVFKRNGQKELRISFIADEVIPSQLITVQIFEAPPLPEDYFPGTSLLEEVSIINVT